MDSILYIIGVICFFILAVFLATFIQFLRKNKTIDIKRTKYLFDETIDYKIGNLSIEDPGEVKLKRQELQNRGAVRLSQGWVLSDEDFQKMKNDELKKDLP